MWLPRLQSLEKSFWVRHISASGITADDCIAAGQRPSDEALQDTPRTDDDEGDHGAKEVDGTTWANDAGHREKE